MVRAYVAGLLTALALGCTTMRPPHAAVQPLTCASFPERLPGARVEKYLVPDAEHCLVHVRQEHAPGYLSGPNLVYESERTIRDGLNAVIENQRGVYLALRAIAASGESAIYVEGNVVEEGRVIDLERTISEHLISGYALDWKEVYTRHPHAHPRTRDAELLKLAGIGPLPSPSDIATHFATHPKRVLEQFIYAMGGDILLAMEGRITLLAPERRPLLVAAQEYAETHGILNTPDAIEVLSERREDALLEIVQENEDPLAVVVFGRAHAWGGRATCGNMYRAGDLILSSKDNISAWNDAHPDARFSLIEVTPHARR